VVERPAERAQAGEADFEADVGHAVVGCAQEEHRPFDAAALQVAMRRFAERRAERATEVRFGDFRNPREARDVEWLPKVAVHCVPRAEHPAIALFHDSSHPIRTSLLAGATQNGALHFSPVGISAPAFFIHAENDYSTTSGPTLAAEMERLGKTHAPKIGCSPI
jgi:hypothetical protein